MKEKVRGSNLEEENFEKPLSISFQILGGITYAFLFNFFQEAGLTTAIQDESFGKKYWEICEKLVQLKDSEPHL